ncbi:hypothetical protein MKK70_11120 [Methylobacterium sp. E-041]|uniref:hypothetical protein n=1 Tax=Methylobacterium sp. E-041 TaxID=2836573 RepID=UPI001FBAAAAC|nr:hypothetical protein [Methylobacterium sp. E-041]MCJ2105916.1 hypothetical protein [Methylobacterium sp. E-041]
MGIFERFGLAFVLAGFLLASEAHSELSAQSGSDQLKRATVLPAVRASTACIASGVSRQSGITGQSSDGAISEGIRRVIAGGGCDDAIIKMVAVYERTYGPGTGTAFFSGAYGRDLPRAVRSRLADGTQTGSQSGTGDRQGPLIGQRAIQPSQPVQVAPVVGSAPAVTAPSIYSETTKPKTLAEIQLEQAFWVLMGNIAGIFALAGCATFVLFSIGLGSRWVVFADSGDLGRTSSIVIGPIVTALAIAFEIWRVTLGAPHTILDKAFFMNHWTLLAILAIGTLVVLWGFVSTVTSTIRFNGLAMGSAIAVLKLTAIVFVPLALFGAMHLTDPSNPEQRHRPNVALWIIFGLAIWFGSKLINGPRVLRRRSNTYLELSYTKPSSAY